MKVYVLVISERYSSEGVVHLSQSRTKLINYIIKDGAQNEEYPYFYSINIGVYLKRDQLDQIRNREDVWETDYEWEFNIHEEELEIEPDVSG